MDLAEAEHLLKRWDPNSEPATLGIVEALDLVQFEHDAVQAEERFTCPTCGAAVRRACEGGLTHRRRINLLRYSPLTPSSGPIRRASPARSPSVFAAVKLSH